MQQCGWRLGDESARVDSCHNVYVYLYILYNIHKATWLPKIPILITKVITVQQRYNALVRI